MSYTELEILYQRYKDKGLSVLAFPCNQFGAQEPGMVRPSYILYNCTAPLLLHCALRGIEKEGGRSDGRVHHAICNMQYATCNMQHATCNMQHATCNMQHANGRAGAAQQRPAQVRLLATCDMQHATCDMRHATCNMQHATCNMQHAVSSHESLQQVQHTFTHDNGSS